MTQVLPGTEVSARGLRWEVAFVQAAGDQQLYRLRCLEGALRGREFDLLSPFETIEPIAKEPNPTKPGRLCDWRSYHEAFLLEQELGPNALLAAHPGRLRPMAYQLVPVLRALGMPRARLLLADDVGLGKTIQAGLVLTELIARRRAHRILVVAPAGPLLTQWKRELRERFGLRFDVLDATELKRIRYGNELGANPFDHVALGLISIDFAKQERVLQDLERSHYDVVVIDEAHHCVSTGGPTTREDSLRRRLAEVLSQRTDSLLLLTATPHDGHEPHFASLLQLLDASLVDGKGVLRGERYRQHVVRRLKRHIVDPDTGRPMFRERTLIPVPVRLDRSGAPEFARLQQELVGLIAPQLRRAVRRKRYDDVLAFLALLKRSVSTARACERTLTTVHERLCALQQQGAEEQEAREQRIRTLKELKRRQDRFGALSFDEEQARATLEAEDIAAELARPDDAERDLAEAKCQRRRGRQELATLAGTLTQLDDLIRLANSACHKDPKLEHVLSLVRDIRRSEPRANILIYTEYSDSQQAVVKALSDATTAGSVTGDILSLSGADPEKTREAVTERFREHDELILVSTDATAEGLNLHERCHHLIHLELPYNPNRLEQRNGRIDRFGQERDPIIHYLYLQGTFEERLLLRLVAKYERQKARLHFVPNTLGLDTSSFDADLKLLEGLAEEEGELFKTLPVDLERAAQHDDVSSAAYRDLLAELDRVFRDFERGTRGHGWIGATGLNADAHQLQMAHGARTEGEHSSPVDLAAFVASAFTTERAGRMLVQADGTISLDVPAELRSVLKDLPGYDEPAQLLRLTTDIRRMRDAENHSVGYLGQAHPIVRYALDRVRRVQLTGGNDWLDRRVAVARGHHRDPSLLFTFLGRLSSGRGREFERVLGVEWTKGGKPQGTEDPGGWYGLCADDRAIPPRAAWKTYFESWASLDEPAVEQAATAAFKPLADAFRTQHQQMLDVERRELELWLRTRADEICGQPQPQRDLFAPAEAPSWRTSSSPRERLAGYALDRSNPSRQRTEAQTAITLFQRRLDDEQLRSTLAAGHVSMLGVLLLVPEDVEVQS